MGIIIFLIVIILVFIIRYVLQLKARQQKEKRDQYQRRVITQASSSDPITVNNVQDISTSHSNTQVQLINHHIGLLEEAINNHKKVQFNYINRSGKKTYRTIEPKIFKQVYHTQCIEGYCYLREEIRTFAIKRISNLVILSDSPTSQPITQVAPPPIIKPGKVQRPYMKDETETLKKIADANWDNLQVLFDIYQELNFRHRKKAKLLQQKIEQQLQKLKSFPWPDTDISPSSHHLPPGVFTHDKGLLSYLGYKVGKKGLPDDERRKILDLVFLHSLPTIEDKEYLRKWGRPRTEKRLRRLAISLTSFIRNAKRITTKDFSKAIEDWESDLDYLKKTYYECYFHFKWPIT